MFDSLLVWIDTSLLIQYTMNSKFCYSCDEIRTRYEKLTDELIELFNSLFSDMEPADVDSVARSWWQNLYEFVTYVRGLTLSIMIQKIEESLSKDAIRDEMSYNIPSFEIKFIIGLVVKKIWGR